jgi:hypothetical protein
MIVQGTLNHGSIILDQPLSLPDGTRVEVDVNPVAQAVAGTPTFLDLLEFAGCMPDLPPDFAAQHDHYIHGTPKK